MADKLRIFYSGHDFFGHWDCLLECVAYYPEVKDLRKALLQFKKDRSSVIHIEEGNRTIVLEWDSYEDFGGEIVTVKDNIAWNHIETRKMAYPIARKLANDLVKTKTEVA